MIKVKFDSTEISSDYIYELTRTHELFENNFKLGSVSAQTYTLKVDKDGVTNKNPSFVYILDGTTPLATLLVDNLNEDDKLVYEYNLIDSMILLNFNYSAQPLMPTIDNPQPTDYPTLLQVLQDICSQAGLTLANNSFNQSTMRVQFYDNSYTARDYVSFIAELNGGYAVINTAGELELKQFSNTSVANIDIEDCENFKLGELHTITRVLYDDASGTYWEYGSTSGNTVYLNINNPYINDQTIVQSIYNIINGFSFYSASVDNSPTVSGEVGQIMTYVDGSDSYPSIIQIVQRYGGSMWYGGYSTMVESPLQEETTVNSAKQQIKNIKTIIDRENGEFSRQISDLDGNLSELSQTVSSISGTVTDLNRNITENMDFTADGLIISREGSDMKGVFGNSSLEFKDGNTTVAWIDGEEGLGATEISVGDPTQPRTRRWRIFSTSDGSHLRFTRHTS